MEDKFETLKSVWKASKTKAVSTINAKQMLDVVKKNQQFSKKQHVHNILILAFTFIGLALFFYFYAPLQTLLSHVGIFFMLGVLAFRIFVEIVSRKKGKSIFYEINSVDLTHKAIVYYEWRKKIHGAFTTSLFSLYSIGFFILIPEFSEYIEQKWIIGMLISYLLIAIILIILIRTGNDRELKLLKEINTIRQELETTK